ncbi:hypothetical protein DFH09DRAFT_286258 [Mycena vulgaris]|nr:hypothetical protein DFH09DRAFT_474117 [Mycena vulgaris]KAJ6582463.1 hypothetical protein DFH09DRAFT_286258 [Mycena vulgaris]
MLTSSAVAALAMVIWDYLITLEDERELFWKRKWTFATFLFLWSRYLGIFLIIFGVSVAVSPNLTDSVSYLWLRVESWVGMSTLCSIQVILQLRIYALYDGSPKVTALIISVFFMEVICAVAMFGFTSANIRVVAEAMGDMVRCKVTAVPSWLWLFWVAVTSFELLLCVLALYKGYQRIRISGLFKSQQVLQDILLRDSVLFYVAIQGVYIFNLVFWIQDPKDSLDVLTGMAVAVPCVMCGRLMINVRQALPHRDTLISPSDISLGQI